MSYSFSVCANCNMSLIFEYIDYNNVVYRTVLNDDDDNDFKYISYDSNYIKNILDNINITLEKKYIWYSTSRYCKIVYLAYMTLPNTKNYFTKQLELLDNYNQKCYNSKGKELIKMTSLEEYNNIHVLINL